ncbi:MAG: NAD(P)-dependent oxidoreductase [Pedobacter sp.]|nr:MAG: NAD(P)-dependent oxidoreductase [Pedobacter sp.]
MSEKVLITGATGFVGYHLIDQALLAGLEVYAAVRQQSDTSHLDSSTISFVILDYSSVEELRLVLEKHQFQYIIHAAGITKAKEQVVYDKVNAEFTRNLGMAISTVNYKVKKFVFLSSLAALGPLKNLSEKLQDNSEPHPVTSYGASKILAEQYLSKISGLPIITIRPTAVYGPREKDLFILFNTINKGLEPYIGNFKQQLSFVYVIDLATIVVKALFSEIVGTTYNVSDGKVYDRYALGFFIRKALGKNTLKFHLPIAVVSLLASTMELIYSRSKEAPTLNKEKMAELTAVNWACDIKNIQKDLGYVPVFDLEKGVSETVSWYKSNNWI